VQHWERPGGRFRFLTNIEEIDSRFVTSNVKIILEQSLSLEPQLGEIVAPIVPEKQQSAGFQHLGCGVSSPGWKSMELGPNPVNVLYGIEPFIWMQRAENEDEDCNVHASGF
jgi:hypothetical protein